ncbi:MAG TPA: efflux RND transporter periplasmic adaptor subunit [Candidatus Acidoferrum sp.]|nr:efflux RND transporter periplasmic adaptor subunit [Candidatus Acidoferrum sp.]
MPFKPAPPRFLNPSSARSTMFDQPCLPLLVGAFISLAALFGCSKQAAAPGIAPDVKVATVEQRDVPIVSEWVATLDGYVNAQIQPQVTGYIVQQTYKEGAPVRKGDILFEIDQRPFQAVLDQAKAQLAQAQAQLGKTKLDVDRDTPLAKERAIAQSQLDNDIQANLAADAAVQSAKAQVEQAQLNLGFTHVTSLVDGIAGIAQVQIGNLVNPLTVLTSVSQVNPIKAFFPISEQEYLRLAEKINSQSQLEVPKDAPMLDLVLADGTTYPQKGHILYTDREVDIATGSIRIASAFPNAKNILRPGQFGRVRASTYTRNNALLVPQRAVIEIQGTYQLAVVGSDNKVNVRIVKVGERVGTQWIIDSGVKSGEMVIVEGVQKVRDGSSVKPTLLAAATGAN